MGIIKAIDLALAKYKDRYGNKKFEEGERYVYWVIHEYYYSVQE